MGHADSALLDRSPRATSGTVTLLYIRSTEGQLDTLERRLDAIVERYAPLVSLRSVDPGELSGSLEQLCSPAVVVLRDGEVVGKAVGAYLPTRELDRIVRRAIEWHR